MSGVRSCGPHEAVYLAGILNEYTEFAGYAPERSRHGKLESIGDLLRLPTYTVILATYRQSPAQSRMSARRTPTSGAGAEGVRNYPLEHKVTDASGSTAIRGFCQCLQSDEKGS
jgi:hypothetical protein